MRNKFTQSKSCTKQGFLLFLSMLLTIGGAFAQIEVIPGEYVVKLKGKRPIKKLFSSERQYVKSKISKKQFVVHSDKAILEDFKILTVKGFVASARKALQNKSARRQRRRKRRPKRKSALSLVSDRFCKRLLRRRDVLSCSPNFLVKRFETPNDAAWPLQWNMTGLFGINAPAAWDKANSSEDIVIAVMDTGIDYTHADLRPNMWINPFEILNGEDDDGNGYIDDYNGVNTIRENGNPIDTNGHGSHVAGIIGARGNNGRGIAGVSWNTQLMAVKILDDDGAGTLESILDGFEYINEMKRRGINIRVVNASWGGGETAIELYNAVKRTVNNDMIVVAAAGNESSDNDRKPVYPANYEINGVVTVGSLTGFGTLSSFSNFGQSVDIAAPGSLILSTFPVVGYLPMSGTSMAAPHVAGALALLYGDQPGLSQKRAINKLLSSAKTVPGIEGKIKEARALDLPALLN